MLKKKGADRKVVLTRHLVEELKRAETIQDFLKKNQNNLFNPNLSFYLWMQLDKRNLNRANVAKKAGLEKNYVCQIFNDKRRPSRDKLIALTIGMELSVIQTQRALMLGGHRELYARIARDAVILFAIQRKMDIMQVDTLLYETGFPTLHESDK